MLKKKYHICILCLHIETVHCQNQMGFNYVALIKFSFFKITKRVTVRLQCSVFAVTLTYLDAFYPISRLPVLLEHHVDFCLTQVRQKPLQRKGK